MAEPTHISGQRYTGNIAANRRVMDVDNKIFLLEPRNNPFVTFLTTVGKSAPDGSNYKGAGILKKESINPKFTWFSV